MSFLERIRNVFSSTPNTAAISQDIQSSMTRLSQSIATYSFIAVVMSTAMTDVASAQTSKKDTVKVPKIETVERAEVDGLYKQAAKINADDAFTSDEGDNRAKLVKELKGEFDHVADEIQSLIDEGHLDDAYQLLDVLGTSVQNTHWNLTHLLRSAKENDGDQEHVDILESLLQDLGSVQDSIDKQRNVLAQEIGDIETLKQRVEDHPHATLEDQGDTLELRITGTSAKLSIARSKAMTTLNGLMNDLDIEGETHFDIDVPDEGDITVTAITTIQFK